MRRTQELALQAEAELKRSREQNEGLRLSVEQMRLELIRLREEVHQLSSRMLPAQTNVAVREPAESGPQTAAEEPDRAPKTAGPDAGSAGRLTRIEDQVEINTAQIKEQAQTKVESDSRFPVRLFGTILSNTYYNTSGRSDAAVPTAAPPGTGGRNGNFGATLRQTQFGLAMTGPRLGGAALSADVDFDFYGATATTYGSNALGVLRMRTASVRLDGPLTSLALGLMAPMVSPLNPTSLASVYYPALGDSGNLWQWRPQMTLERRLAVGEADDFVLQGGLMMPFGDTVNGSVLKGRPGYESRVAFARKLDAERRLELGIGGYFHPQPFGAGRTVDSYAATGDWLIPLGNRLELSGEAFYGQSIGLSQQSGGNVADEFAFNGPLDQPGTAVRGIRSFGGWAQLSARATPQLEFNLAFGLDDPRNRDIFRGLFDNTRRLKNQTFSVNSIYRLRSNFLVALEYRNMWTTYPDARNTSGQVNIALGYLF
jgi:hypothetical protein